MKHKITYILTLEAWKWILLVFLFQIIKARHGNVAHIVYSFQALLVNVVILSNLLVAGTATIKNVTKDASDEFCTLIIATLFGCYSFIGGLGTTFYVSYFNTVSIYVCLIIIIVNIFYTSDDNDTYSFRSVYDRLINETSIENNLGGSYLTFISGEGLIYALVGLILTSSITYCDQASWQSRIAAKPMQGVTGFFLAALMWFAIPSSIAITTGMTFLSLKDENGCLPLTMEQVDEGKCIFHSFRGDHSNLKNRIPLVQYHSNLYCCVSWLVLYCFHNR